MGIDDDLPLIDRRYLDDIASMQEQGDPSLVEHFTSLYLLNAPKHLAAIKTAIDSGNMKGVENAAHSLKGSSGSLGLERLARKCSKLEESAEAGEREALQPLFAEITCEFDASRQTLTELLREYTS